MIVGQVYLERGQPVTVLIRWAGKGPRNVLIERADRTKVVRPFRGLRKPKESVPMMSKQPTASAISGLLRRSGFQRSDYGDKGVMWNEASAGFSVWKTYHADSPQRSYVAVQHVVPGDGREWGGRKEEMRSRLAEYAAVLREAGYAAVVRDQGRDNPPWLVIMTVVTAGKDGEDG